MNMNVNTYMIIRRFEDVVKCKCKSADNRGLFTFIVQYLPPHRLPTCILLCRSVKKRYTGKVELCLPLHLNLSSRIESIFRFWALFGDSHLAPDVSIGCAWRYTLSQRRLQSQMNGFLAKCLRKKNQITGWRDFMQHKISSLLFISITFSITFHKFFYTFVQVKKCKNFY